MSLPLKVKVGIRDHWAAENGSLQVSLRKLGDVLGKQVIVDPEWQLLLNELGDFYPDKLNFVQIVAGCVETLINSITELLDDEAAHEEWIETLLETIKQRSQLRLLVETAGPGQPVVSWSEQRLALVVRLPKRQIVMPSELAPGFRGGLLGCFDKEPSPADDWADVKLESSGNATITEKAPQPQALPGTITVPEFLPNWESLPRPDDLLLRPPYYLTLDAGTQQIQIEGSHSPSLKLLSDYLKRWCRVNHNDTRSPPAVTVKLHQSAFGLSELFDRLELDTSENRYSQFRPTAPMVLSLIEGVLGYKLISTQGRSWNFRRDSEFRLR